jgi:hypothetical protein
VSTFKIGDIVEVTGLELNFRGQQGQVVAITSDKSTGETIHVWHGAECDHLLDYQERQLLDPGTAEVPPSDERYMGDSRTQRYVEADLTCVDEWKPEIVAKRLFGDRWHRILLYRALKCCVCGCKPAQKKRTFFNCHGLVMVLTTCEDCHRRNHGVCGDDFSKA